MSSAIVAAGVGSAAGGSFADTFGRKHALLLADVLFTVGAVGMGTAWSADVLIAGKKQQEENPPLEAQSPKRQSSASCPSVPLPQQRLARCLTMPYLGILRLLTRSSAVLIQRYAHTTHCLPFPAVTALP